MKVTIELKNISIRYPSKSLLMPSYPFSCPLILSQIKRLYWRNVKITADTALRLAKFSGTSPKFWIELQSQYHLDVTADKLGERLEKEVREYSEVVWDSVSVPDPQMLYKPSHTISFSLMPSHPFKLNLFYLKPIPQIWRSKIQDVTPKIQETSYALHDKD